MQYRPLGNTDTQVSSLCLGTMTFGEQNSETEAFGQMDRALDAGINFFDTAELYPVPGRAETQGLTETHIGNWMQARGTRDRIVLATKVAAHADWAPHIRPGDDRLHRANIRAALEGSLRRLQTDVIDLYQVHWPDRSTNCFGSLNYVHAPNPEDTPIATSLQALGELVQEGKIRHIGISNETPWGLMQYLLLAERLGLPRVVSIQNPYSLLNRSFEVGLAEMAIREQVGLLAYSPLGFGMLTGKYSGGVRPEGARLTLFPDYARYSNPLGVAASERYVQLARDHGLSPAAMALAFITSRPFTTSCIIGATRMEQLEENLSSAELALSEAVLQEIEAIGREFSNPCP